MLTTISDFIFNSTKLGLLWLVARLYLGYLWVMAGYEKIINPAWVGDNAGVAMTGFIKGALAKTGGLHPDVSMWYAWFLEHMVLPNVEIWSYAISYGELLVGLGLIVGLLTYLASFFGFFMNLNFLLAGTVSTNPVMLVIALLLMMASKPVRTFSLDNFFFRRS